MATRKKGRPNSEGPSSKSKKEAAARPGSSKLSDEVLKQRIIRAAADSYRERGYRRTTMSDITRRMNLTRPALYWYFTSKDQILYAFLDNALKDMLQFVSALVLSTDPFKKLWEFVHAKVLWHMHQIDLSAGYERTWAETPHDSLLPQQRIKIEALEKKIFDLCSNIVVACPGKSLNENDLMATVYGIFNMAETINRWFHQSKSYSVPELAKLYADMAVVMVKAVKGAPIK